MARWKFTMRRGMLAAAQRLSRIKHWSLKGRAPPRRLVTAPQEGDADLQAVVCRRRARVRAGAAAARGRRRDAFGARCEQ
eukprot:6190268-Pleurochrysis_carterae.AAC.1